MNDEQRIARNVSKVKAFVDAWGAIDCDAVMACLSDDIVYINQPLEPVIGRRDVREIVDGIMRLSKRVKWELLNCFGHDDTVVTERLDCWDFDNTGWAVKLPCVGMFDLNEDGLICGWRDYFDNRMWFENGGPTLELERASE